MTKEQYWKLQSKLGIRNCPICGNQAIYCCYDRVNLFSPDGVSEHYENIEIPDCDYIEMECRNCSHIMKFNLRTLLK